MNDIKSQPIDKRTLIPFWIRIVASTIAVAVLLVLIHKFLPDVLGKLKLSEHEKWVRWAAPITAVLMYLRYVIKTFRRKWSYAFAVYVYDVMKRSDADICPRCKTRLDKDMNKIDYTVSDPSGRVLICSCPNTNCGLSLQKKMTFSKCPSTKNGQRAFILNLGVRRDYEETVLTQLVSFVSSLAINAAIASLVAVKLIPLIEKLL